jgi:uncharacterized PurR-regulated membrane protein YhhQ (DUF165 family)
MINVITFLIEKLGRDMTAKIVVVSFMLTLAFAFTSIVYFMSKQNGSERIEKATEVVKYEDSSLEIELEQALKCSGKECLKN